MLWRYSFLTEALHLGTLAYCKCKVFEWYLVFLVLDGFSASTLNSTSSFLHLSKLKVFKTLQKLGLVQQIMLLKERLIWWQTFQSATRIQTKKVNFGTTSSLYKSRGFDFHQFSFRPRDHTRSRSIYILATDLACRRVPLARSHLNHTYCKGIVNHQYLVKRSTKSFNPWRIWKHSSSISFTNFASRRKYKAHSTNVKVKGEKFVAKDVDSSLRLPRLVAQQLLLLGLAWTKYS